MSRYKCHACKIEWSTENMASFCGLCYYKFQSEIVKMDKELKAMDKQLKVMAVQSTDWEIRAKEAEAQLSAGGRNEKN